MIEFVGWCAIVFMACWLMGAVVRIFPAVGDRLAPEKDRRARRVAARAEELERQKRALAFEPVRSPVDPTEAGRVYKRAVSVAQGRAAGPRDWQASDEA